ncbi:MAG: NUDIX domain-containing protein [Bacteroidota bacterium]
MLDSNSFKCILKNTNLFAFDLILQDQNDKILLGLRRNKPAKNFWFVPGGRVYKNEALIDGLKRILINETGLTIEDIFNVRIHGLYDHLYPDNFFEDASFNTHYIICCLKADIKSGKCIKKDEQHTGLSFFSPEQIQTDNTIHQFTKNYFLDKPDNRFPFF